MNSRDRLQMGQAYLENSYTREGTPIGIHQGGALRALEGHRQAQGELLDKPAIPAKVVSRFPKL